MQVCIVVRDVQQVELLQLVQDRDSREPGDVGWWATIVRIGVAEVGG